MAPPLRNTLNDVHNFNTSTFPPITNKVIIVTGGNAGIGLETVLVLSKHSPAKIYLACRSQAKFDAAMQIILESSPDARTNVEMLELDLSSFASIKSAADKVMSENDRLDILINNAGIMGAPAGVTKDGYESHFGVNYLGPALLTKLLLPLMLKTAKRDDVAKGDVRVVDVSSAAALGLVPKHKDGIDLGPMKTARGDTHSYWLYGISKFAQVIEAIARAKRYPEIMSVAIHPGRIQTTLLDGFLERSKWSMWGIIQRVFDTFIGPMTTQQGALTQLWAATAKSAEMENGGFYFPIGVKESDGKWFDDEAFGTRLWEWTEKQFEEKGYA